MPTYVITGASCGIGLELARQLSARGDKVYATVRAKAASADGVDQISGLEGDNVTVIEGIDVTQDDVGSKLQAALAGVTIDVLVHNAGSINATREIEGGSMFGEQAGQGGERRFALFITIEAECVMNDDRTVFAQEGGPDGAACGPNTKGLFVPEWRSHQLGT